ncbi:MAG: GNAT family N-acetyltransferase [Methanolobus sp.]|uniref:GNAT family N-acetyltransferase n=1 Tax=Methanolobus sp. TaxID=1874737 RepID=UPI0027318CA6|nr:GNAT family N-acetyltransferase [Methanolobus sp.]MDP2215952.1 GNAT family N-acetyltransferase [Methanolobus sp.]
MIMPFSNEYSCAARSLVLKVLQEEGFAYDPVKDSDLENIRANYVEKGGAFFIALEGDELTGTSAVKKAGPDTCEIKRIYVRKEWRGKGIGRDLFNAALSYAAANYEKAVLKTDLSLHTATDMYIRHGFTIVKEEGCILYLEKIFY